MRSSASFRTPIASTPTPSCAASLSPRARRYWDLRRGLVAGGVLYAGRLETTLARFASLLRRAGLMQWPDAAFAATTLAEQRGDARA